MRLRIFAMSSIGVILLSLILIASSMASQDSVQQENKTQENKTVKIINFINGYQGDKSFFDSAVRGLEKARQDFKVKLEVETIEAGYDPVKWQPALEYVADHEDYDILVTGTEDMSRILQSVAAEHKDKKFILYDASVNYTECDCKNVYSVLYKQNESAYLAGAYAGLMTKSGIIGILGGRDTPVINDFVVGYEQGARSVRPNVTVIKQYAGSWNDTGRGKELALEMYRDGADIVFQAAGSTGQGVFQAAQESKRFAIGVDSDQAQIIEQTKPEQAKLILTSAMKNVDNSLYRAIGLFMEGKLPFGQAERLGIREGGVGLARNKYYENATPTPVKTRIDQAENDLVEGKIAVDTALK